MPIPKLNVPIYETTLPSGTKLSFRPFLVKEEKLLLIAKHAGDVRSMIMAVKQVLQNCIEGLSSVSIDKLPLFDIEYFFLQLRARSIGEIATLHYKCTNCDTISNYSVDLMSIKPQFGEGHTKTIPLTETVGVTMRYPAFTSFERIAKEDLPAQESYAMVLECIESIYDKDQVYYTKDIPEKEVQDFVDSLTPRQAEKIDLFFDTLPKIQTTIQFDCPKCATKSPIVVEGLDSFFL